MLVLIAGCNRNNIKNIYFNNKVNLDNISIETLDSGKFVDVFVTLNALSSQQSEPSGKRNFSKYLELKNESLKIQDNILDKLSEDEFKLDKKSIIGRWFSGHISKKGLIKLVNNPNIFAISNPIYGTLASDNESKEDKCPEVKGVDCFPAVEKESNPYCEPNYRSWIQENCNISYLD